MQAVVALRPAGFEVSHDESHNTKDHAFRMRLLSKHVNVLSVSSFSGPELRSVAYWCNLRAVAQTQKVRGQEPGMLGGDD